MPSALWLFAHNALAKLFHANPVRFVKTLDGAEAPGFLEQNWQWALEAAAERDPASPPLRYSIDTPRPGLAIVGMSFRGVVNTGEPWHIRFIARAPDDANKDGYARVFMLEHSEYATEREGMVRALVCESGADGRHHNWGITLDPNDEPGFDDAVIATLRANAAPSATFVPPKE